MQYLGNITSSLSKFLCEAAKSIYRHKNNNGWRDRTRAQAHARATTSRAESLVHRCWRTFWVPQKATLNSMCVCVGWKHFWHKMHLLAYIMDFSCPASVMVFSNERLYGRNLKLSVSWSFLTLYPWELDFYMNSFWLGRFYIIKLAFIFLCRE